MLILIALLFPFQSYAEKIVFELRGENMQVDVGQGGGVTSDAKILWRESIHGELPTGLDLLTADAEDYQEPAFDRDGKPIMEPLLDKKGRVVFGDDGKAKLSDKQAMVTKRRLVANPTKFAAKLAKDAAAATKAAREASDRAALKPILDKVDAGTSLKAAEQIQFNKAMKDKLGL